MEPFAFYNVVMPPKDVDRMANSVDPDQAAPEEGAAWSGSAMFALSYLHQYLTF